MKMVFDGAHVDGALATFETKGTKSLPMYVHSL